MSKVFSAKRKTAEFEYEFLDGTKSTLTARSLSTKEQEEVPLLRGSSKNFSDGLKTTVRKQLATNDKELVEKVITEQYESGDLIEFSNALTALIRENKEKK